MVTGEFITGINAAGGEWSSECRKSLSLNGAWHFRLDPLNMGMARGWALNPLEAQGELEVPGCIQSLPALSEEYPPEGGMQNSYLGTFWLEKSFHLPHKEGDELEWLYLGGVAPAAHIWVNGHYAGFYDHSPIAAKRDITPFLSQGENRLTLAVVEQSTGLLGGMRGGGFVWSGLYRGVSLVQTPACRLEGIRMHTLPGCKEVLIEGELHGPVPANKELKLGAELAPVKDVDGEGTEGFITGSFFKSEAGMDIHCIEGADSYSFQLKLPVHTLPLWCCEAPRLVRLTLSVYLGEELSDKAALTTGLRTLEVQGEALMLNGRPLFLKGVGQEYFSPAISPLTDRALIEKRFQAMKDHGFNFVRFHTHIPTEEELSAADAMGLLLCSEIGLVSNFHKTTPFEEGLVVLEEHIRQTSSHPSLMIYCLGNEGSQLMVSSSLERSRACEGYRLIKHAAPGQLALSAFGLQGELPEVPTDLETSHLWSDDFRWGYEGLTRIPWKHLSRLERGKPDIVHEYGKFGVWPNKEEEGLYPKGGYSSDFGSQGEEVLSELGLPDLTEKVIANSRRLSGECTRIILEEARRQERVKGYVLWTFFRKGGGNAGLCDDMGQRPDQDPALFAGGCNAPIALLIDRGFEGRGLRAGQTFSPGFYLSFYGQEEAAEGKADWKLSTETEILAQGTLGSVRVPAGSVLSLGKASITLPGVTAPVTARLTLSLLKDGRELAVNRWPFWIFPEKPGPDRRDIVYSFTDKAMEAFFKSRFPEAVGLRDLDSVLRGCISWKGMNPQEVLLKYRPGLFVTDSYGDTCRLFAQKGIHVLLLDSGNFPCAWYVKPLSKELGPRDSAFFYSSFRAGWDQGVLATAIQDEPGLLGDFPHEGFCDLPFYAMIQGAGAFDKKGMAESFPDYSRRVLLRSLVKVRAVSAEEAVVQDPNARRVIKRVSPRSFNAREQIYLARLNKGNESITLCSLNYFLDVPGEYLLNQLLKNS